MSDAHDSPTNTTAFDRPVTPLGSLPELPFSAGSERRHQWLWAAIVVNNDGPDTPPRLLNIVGEDESENVVRQIAQRHLDRGYYNVADMHVVAPDLPAPVFRHREEAAEAAPLVPVTLYTMDCPICGADVVCEEGEYSSRDMDSAIEALHYHLEEKHGDLPADEDELNDIGEPSDVE